MCALLRTWKCFLTVRGTAAYILADYRKPYNECYANNYTMYYGWKLCACAVSLAVH